MTSSSASVYCGEIWGVSNKRGYDGACAHPSIVSFPMSWIRDVDGIKEGVHGVVGDETSWRDRILILGRIIVDLRHGVFTAFWHGLGPNS